MSSKQRGLGKGLSALLGDAGNLDSLRSPVGYVNKDVVGTKDPQDTADVLRIPVNMIRFSLVCLSIRIPFRNLRLPSGLSV